MFTVISRITFTQQSNNYLDPVTKKKVVRDKTITYDLSHEFKAKSSWRDLTDDGQITLPKNVTYKDANGRIYYPTDTGMVGFNIGGFLDSTLPPAFMRGDKVTIEWGYAYYGLNSIIEVMNGVNKTETIYNQQIFTGYISQVTSKKPFVLKIEDNMYLLKQVQATGGNNNFFAGKKYTVEKMLAEMISNAGLPFTVNQTTSTLIGDWRAQGTIAEVLAELQRKAGFFAYFKGNELRCGSQVYLPGDDGNLTPGGNPTYPVFDFQRNIISDELEYRRKDDIILSAVCKNTIEEETGKTTKDGQAKTKKTRLEVLITFQNGSSDPTVIIGSTDNPLPPNEGGERHTFTFLGAKTTDDLVALGTETLRHYYYTGFKGKFTTFGMPFIQFGNYINLKDDVLPERNGRYVVKSVEYEGGVGGLRQIIELEYLINTVTNSAT